MIAQTMNHNSLKTHCPRGHSYSAENTKYETSKKGIVSRKCKACISIRLKKKYITSTRQYKINNPDTEYRENNVKHGEFGTRLYGIWNKMKSRCLNENNPDYKDWGGRGISVCEDWLDYENFAEWARGNGYNETMTIDRIDNDGDYMPLNCRWATQKQQANNRRNNRLVSYGGVTQTLQQWADQLDIQTSALRYRLNNWSTQEALTRKIGQ